MHFHFLNWQSPTHIWGHFSTYQWLHSGRFSCHGNFEETQRWEQCNTLMPAIPDESRYTPIKSCLKGYQGQFIINWYCFVIFSTTPQTTICSSVTENHLYNTGIQVSKTICLVDCKENWRWFICFACGPDPSTHLDASHIMHLLVACSLLPKSSQPWSHQKGLWVFSMFWCFCVPLNTAAVSNA